MCAHVDRPDRSCTQRACTLMKSVLKSQRRPKSPTMTARSHTSRSSCAMILLMLMGGNGIGKMLYASVVSCLGVDRSIHRSVGGPCLMHLRGPDEGHERAVPHHVAGKLH